MVSANGVTALDKNRNFLLAAKNRNKKVISLTDDFLFVAFYGSRRKQQVISLKPEHFSGITLPNFIMYATSQPIIY